MNTKFLLPAMAFLAIAFGSCGPAAVTFEDLIAGQIDAEVNPYKRVPLGAELKFETTSPCEITVTVEGAIPVTRTIDGYRRTHAIPVIGMYPGIKNTVSLEIKTETGEVATDTLQIATAAMPEFLPEMKVLKADKARMEPGMHLIEMLIANDGVYQAYTMMFDDDGVVRWYMDMTSAQKICYSPLRLRNGNWLYLSWIDLYEITELGKTVRKDQMWGHAGDHHVIEMPNGSFLMGGSGKDAQILRDGQTVTTRFDYMLEWTRDPKPGKALREWDLGQVLDVDRTVFPADYNLDPKADWFHINSIAIDPADNGLLASGRNQGVVKVDQDNNLMWILSPHKGWEKAGREGQGFDTKDFLLTAIDVDGKPYPNDVQQGNVAADDFEWPTGQHALTVMDNGNLLMFDNGLSRNFERTPTYSRAVEYKIDEDNFTISQVWEYGEERGLDLFSGIVSDVDILPQTDNRLITAGNVRLSQSPPNCKMVEIAYPSNEVIFEANVYFKDLKGTGEKSWAQFDLVYRGERYPLFTD